ncbi:MAG: hypothetical protein LBS19_09615 [Clostridiales bacterium]|jgi:L-fucose isomerase-like protein|nr:hypothetical protein [Clostridiales bacterium]
MNIAYLIANRGFFPSSVIEQAHSDIRNAFARANVSGVTIPADATRYGAVETTDDGMVFANFLARNRGQYDGLVICLPNFGDENGIKAAIQDCEVPILLQAYPDELEKLDFEHRRDAFCGKFALTSVLTQMGKAYSAFTPFVAAPSSSDFDIQLRKFIGVCRVVKRMRRLRIGAVGARTTAFKSVRYDECALERHGIDVETYDLSSLLARFRKISENNPEAARWLDELHETASFENVPAQRDMVMARFAAALDAHIRENCLDAVAVRCWSELQQELGITPCAVMGILNHRGIPAVCEMDVTNAIAMLGLSLATEIPAGCMDLNNNYGNEADKCILFHCGPLPLELMQGTGVIQQHKMLSKTYGEGCSWGLNVGRMRQGTVTMASVRTDSGELQFYAASGEVTADTLPASFFGSYGVVQKPGLQDTLASISRQGFRHHVAVTMGDAGDVLTEAFTNYLGYRRVCVEAAGLAGAFR